MADVQDIEVDFKVHDGYVAFSAEVVRLALLAPTAFAFFLALSGEDAKAQDVARLIAPGQGWLFGSLAFMTFAVLFGLCHRYCAIDLMCVLVEKRRKGESMRGDWRTWASSISIFAAPFCLTVGAALLFVAFFKVLG